MATNPEKQNVLRKFNYTSILFFFFYLFLLGLVIFFLTTTNSQKESKQILTKEQKLVSDNLKAFITGDYLDLTGNRISLSDYLGKTILVISWATWCPQCLDILLEVDDIFSKSDNLVILAINRAEDKKTVVSFLKNNNVQLKNIKIILDKKDNFYRTIKAYAMPKIAIYDCDGRLFYHQTSYQRLALLKNINKSNKSCPETKKE